MFSDEDDLDCPLCMEEFDISDRNFRPCPCGYQICRFCWHHIKEDHSGKCPACRRIYSEENIEFTPISADEIALIKHEKKAKEREKKEIEAQSRKHLSNMRVVQKSLVYVIGLPSKLANDEQTLRQHEYFGQYGKIAKVVINRRNASSGVASSPAQPSYGVYITYARKEDAARAIAAIDGSSWEGKSLRASYGTTKYCTYYLRGMNCQNQGCMYLHEPGEDADSFTKEDLANGKHQQNEQPSYDPYSNKSTNSARPPQPAQGPLTPGSKPATVSSYHSTTVSLSDWPAPGGERQHSQEDRDRDRDRAKDDESSALPVTASWARIGSNPSTPILLNSTPVTRKAEAPPLLRSKGSSTPIITGVVVNNGKRKEQNYTKEEPSTDYAPTPAEALALEAAAKQQAQQELRQQQEQLRKQQQQLLKQQQEAEQQAELLRQKIRKQKQHEQEQELLEQQRRKQQEEMELRMQKQREKELAKKEQQRLDQIQKERDTQEKAHREKELRERERKEKERKEKERREKELQELKEREEKERAEQERLAKEKKEKEEQERREKEEQERREKEEQERREKEEQERREREEQEKREKEEQERREKKEQERREKEEQERREKEEQERRKKEEQEWIEREQEEARRKEEEEEKMKAKLAREEQELKDRQLAAQLQAEAHYSNKPVLSMGSFAFNPDVTLATLPTSHGNSAEATVSTASEAPNSLGVDSYPGMAGFATTPGHYTGSFNPFSMEEESPIRHGPMAPPLRTPLDDADYDHADARNRPVGPPIPGKPRQTSRFGFAMENPREDAFSQDSFADPGLNLQSMQEGFRALFPNVNVSFGYAGNSPGSHPSRPQPPFPDNRPQQQYQAPSMMRQQDTAPPVGFWGVENMQGARAYQRNGNYLNGEPMLPTSSQRMNEYHSQSLAMQQQQRIAPPGLPREPMMPSMAKSPPPGLESFARNDFGNWSSLPQHQQHQQHQQHHQHHHQQHQHQHQHQHQQHQQQQLHQLQQLHQHQHQHQHQQQLHQQHHQHHHQQQLHQHQQQHQHQHQHQYQLQQQQQQHHQLQQQHQQQQQQQQMRMGGWNYVESQPPRPNQDNAQDFFGAFLKAAAATSGPPDVITGSQAPRGATSFQDPAIMSMRMSSSGSTRSSLVEALHQPLSRGGYGSMNMPGYGMLNPDGSSDLGYRLNKDLTSPLLQQLNMGSKRMDQYSSMKQDPYPMAFGTGESPLLMNNTINPAAPAARSAKVKSDLLMGLNAGIRPERFSLKEPTAAPILDENATMHLNTLNGVKSSSTSEAGGLYNNAPYSGDAGGFSRGNRMSNQFENRDLHSALGGYGDNSHGINMPTSGAMSSGPISVSGPPPGLGVSPFSGPGDNLNKPANVINNNGDNNTVAGNASDNGNDNDDSEGNQSVNGPPTSGMDAEYGSYAPTHGAERAGPNGSSPFIEGNALNVSGPGNNRALDMASMMSALDFFGAPHPSQVGGSEAVLNRGTMVAPENWTTLPNGNRVMASNGYPMSSAGPGGYPTPVSSNESKYPNVGHQHPMMDRGGNFMNQVPASSASGASTILINNMMHGREPGNGPPMGHGQGMPSSGEGGFSPIAAVSSGTPVMSAAAIPSTTTARSVEDLELQVINAKKETQMLENQLNAVIKRNRRKLYA